MGFQKDLREGGNLGFVSALWSVVLTIRLLNGGGICNLKKLIFLDIHEDMLYSHTA